MFPDIKVGRTTDYTSKYNCLFYFVISVYNLEVSR